MHKPAVRTFTLIFVHISMLPTQRTVCGLQPPTLQDERSPPCCAMCRMSLLQPSTCKQRRQDVRNVEAIHSWLERAKHKDDVGWLGAGGS